MKFCVVPALLLAASSFGQVTAGATYHNSGSTTATTGTVTMSSVDANSCVVLAEMVDDDGTTTFNTPTATGLTFAQIGSTLHSNSNFYLLLWRAYSTSSLGSTVITATWNTTSADWLLAATDFTGTAATSANNCSDGIGVTNTATGSSTTQSVSVSGSTHDQSKYFGAVVMANGASPSLVKGSSYTALMSNTFNSNFISGLTEISTSAVTPAQTTTVNSTSTTSASWGVFGVEMLKASAGGGSGGHSLSLLGAGPS